jgi:hypothetical protein
MALRAFLIAFLILTVSGAGLRAQAPQAALADIYSLRGVEVDRTAATATLAREQAVVEGQRLAWRRLLARLVPAERRNVLANLPAADLAALIDSFEIENERGSGTRWLGAIAYRFKPGPVRDLLRARDVPYAETPARRVLVLPLLLRDGQALLWEEDNLWRTAWASVPPPDGLQPWVLPRGDLDDVGLIGAEQAVQFDKARLRALSVRHGAQGAIVVVAEFNADAAGGPAVQLQFARVGAAAPDADWSQTAALTRAETIESAWPRIAAVAATAIEERWKAEVATQGGSTTLLRAAIPVTHLSQWVAVRRRLAEVAAVRHVDLLVLGRGGAVVEIRHEGSTETLRTALAQRDLALREEGGAWTLSLAGTGAGARAP